MPTGDIDRVVRFLEYVFVEGKFYSIFSLLFGVGFSLFLFRHGTLRFLRRMLILALIGLVHLLFIWNGDILLLYAVGGMLLTLFIKMKDKVLLCVAVLLMILPIFLNMITQFCGIDFASLSMMRGGQRQAHKASTRIISPRGFVMLRHIPRCTLSFVRGLLSGCGSWSAVIVCPKSWDSSFWVSSSASIVFMHVSTLYL